jgi:hypothetical protein
MAGRIVFTIGRNLEDFKVAYYKFRNEISNFRREMPIKVHFTYIIKVCIPVL